MPLVNQYSICADTQVVTTYTPTVEDTNSTFYLKTRVYTATGGGGGAAGVIGDSITSGYIQFVANGQTVTHALSALCGFSILPALSHGGKVIGD